MAMKASDFVLLGMQSNLSFSLQGNWGIELLIVPCMQTRTFGAQTVCNEGIRARPAENSGIYLCFGGGCETSPSAFEQHTL